MLLATDIVGCFLINAFPHITEPFLNLIFFEIKNDIFWNGDHSDDRRLMTDGVSIFILILLYPEFATTEAVDCGIDIILLSNGKNCNRLRASRHTSKIYYDNRNCLSGTVYWEDQFLKKLLELHWLFNFIKTLSKTLTAKLKQTWLFSVLIESNGQCNSDRDDTL